MADMKEIYDDLIIINLYNLKSIITLSQGKPTPEAIWTAILKNHFDMNDPVSGTSMISSISP